MKKMKIAALLLVVLSAFIFLAGCDGISSDFSGSSDKSVENNSKRDSFSINPLSLFADPVDTSAGAHVLEKTLLSVSGVQPVTFKVRHNSILLNKSQLGRGWNFDYETWLEKNDTGIIVHWNSNRKNLFAINSTNTYKCSDQDYLQDILTQNDDQSYSLQKKDGTKIAFNQQGKMTSITNRIGQILTLSYDTNNCLSSIADSKYGQSITLTYNTNGLIEKIVDNTGRQVSFEYNEYDDLTSITDAKGNTTNYSYDPQGRILIATDREGNQIFMNCYDMAGRIVSQDDGVDSNNITYFQYSENSDKTIFTTTVTDRNGVSKRLYYNAKYQLIESDDSRGRETHYEYNDQGNCITETNPNSTKKVYTYDSKGNMLTVTDEIGNITTMTYDDSSNIITVKDQLGNIVTNTYDNRNLLKTTTDALGNLTSYNYNDDGQILTKTVEGIGTTSFEYENGRLKKVTDPMGNATNYTYDSAGRIKDFIDREGKTTSYTYDNSDNVLSITDPFQNKVSFTYDSSNNKTSETDEKGKVTRYIYNANQKLISKTDALNHTTAYDYDGEDRLTKTTYPDGKFQSISYDNEGRISTLKDESGKTTSYTYAYNNGLKETETVPGISKNTYGYYDNGKLQTIKDIYGGVTTYTYDGAGRLKVVKNPIGKETKYEYDAAGNLLSVTNPLEEAIQYTYDKQGRKRTQQDANGNVTNYDYNANGMLTTVTDALGNKTQYEYDKENRLLKTIDAKEHATTYAYDVKGRLISTTDALGKTISIEYDAKGNVLTLKDANEKTVLTKTYDDVGNVLSQIDALGNTQLMQYDERNRLKQIEDALHNTTKYSYNDAGVLTTVTDPLEGISSKTLDEYGRLYTITDPENNLTTYDYDSKGRVTSETLSIGTVKCYNYSAVLDRLTDTTNGREQVTTYNEYDDAGRLLNFTEPEGLVSYTYDKNGNQLKVKDKKGTISREYDALNRVTKYTDFRGNVIKYSYDEVGNLATITYPGEKIVTYSYDADNRLEKVKDWAGRETIYSYDVSGRMTNTKRPDASLLTMAYNDAGQLTQMKDVNKDGDIINQYDYTYDATGNVKTEKTCIGKDPYVPNILSAEYDKSNRLAKFNGQQVTYDEDGNMINGPLNGSFDNFTYDSRNRLTQAGQTVYDYDAENNRVSVTDAANHTTNYVVNPTAKLSQVLIKTDSDGKQIYYIYGAGLIGQEDSDGNYTVYHFDRRGSTKELTDTEGVVTDRYGYGPYGELVSHTGSTNTPFLYDGRDGVMTDSNGLYYMRSRYYNPEIKRFINQDVVTGNIEDGRSLNRYAYVNGNPVSYNDPFGLSADEDISNFVHGFLDIAGLIPGAGEFADGTNALLYLCEGDYTNAFISSAAMIPYLGAEFIAEKWGSKVVKYGRQSDKLAIEAGEEIEEIAAKEARDEIGDVARDFGKGADFYVAPNGTTFSKQEYKKLIENQPQTLSKIDDYIDLTSFRRDHILNRHKSGVGKPGKTEFPSNWSDERILHNVSDVATDPNAITGVGRFNAPYAIATRDGIVIRVDYYPANSPHAGKISTAYPLNTFPNP